MNHAALYRILDPRTKLLKVRRDLLEAAKILDLAGERETLHYVRQALTTLTDALDENEAIH